MSYQFQHFYANGGGGGSAPYQVGTLTKQIPMGDMTLDGTITYHYPLGVTLVNPSYTHSGTTVTYDAGTAPIEIMQAIANNQAPEEMHNAIDTMLANGVFHIEVQAKVPNATNNYIHMVYDITGYVHAPDMGMFQYLVTARQMGDGFSENIYIVTCKLGEGSYNGNGDGTTKTFTFTDNPSSVNWQGEFRVYLGNQQASQSDYTVNQQNGSITFTTAPQNGTYIGVRWSKTTWEQMTQSFEIASMNKQAAPVVDIQFATLFNGAWNNDQQTLNINSEALEGLQQSDINNKLSVIVSPNDSGATAWIEDKMYASTNYQMYGSRNIGVTIKRGASTQSSSNNVQIKLTLIIKK